jgi:hypothetical protein
MLMGNVFKNDSAGPVPYQTNVLKVRTRASRFNKKIPLVTTGFFYYKNG